MDVKFKVEFEGEEQEVEGPLDVSLSVMELLKAYEYPIEATCGGMGLCGSCHCFVDGDTSLFPIGDDEADIKNNLISVKQYPINDPNNIIYPAWSYDYGDTFPSKSKKETNSDFNVYFYYWFYYKNKWTSKHETILFPNLRNSIFRVFSRVFSTKKQC